MLDHRVRKEGKEKGGKRTVSRKKYVDLITVFLICTA